MQGGSRQTRDLCCSESETEHSIEHAHAISASLPWSSSHSEIRADKLGSAREKVLTAAIHCTEPSSTVPKNRGRRAAFCSHQSEGASIQEGAQVVPLQAQSAESRSNTRKVSNAWYCTVWVFQCFDNRLNTIWREGYYSLRFQHKQEQFQCGGTRPETDPGCKADKVRICDE